METLHKLKSKYGLNIFLTENDVVLPASPSAHVSVVCADDNVQIDFTKLGDDRGDAVKISVPKNHAVTSPIILALPESSSAAHVSLNLHAGSSASLEIIGETESNNAQFEISQGSRSSLQVFSGATGRVMYGALRARLETAAKLQLCEIVCGGPFAYGRTKITLAGDEAEVDIRTIFVGCGSERQDLYTEVVHSAPRTSSSMVMAGVLADSAKTIARGLVKIRRKAAKSSGFQRENVLLLGERAEVDAVPNLEIETDDVRCGHGAAIGRIDEEKLYYLMSRGMDRADAAQMLVEAHLIAALIGLPKHMAEHASKIIKRSLKTFSYDE